MLCALFFKMRGSQWAGEGFVFNRTWLTPFMSRTVMMLAMVDGGKFWPFGWRCYPLLVSLFHSAGSVFSYVLIEFVTMNMPGFGRCGESVKIMVDGMDDF